MSTRSAFLSLILTTSLMAGCGTDEDSTDDDVLMVEGCTDVAAANHDISASQDDGSCAYRVTFTVDLNLQERSLSDVVYLGADFNDWCSTCQPLTDDDGDGIWTASVAVPPGLHEYKYSLNGRDGVVEVIPSPCDVTNGGDNHRGFESAARDSAVAPVVFGRCPGEPVPGMAFGEDYGPEVIFRPFVGSTNAISLDTGTSKYGETSLKVDVPFNGYTGGTLVAPSADLSGYTGLTFWVKASTEQTLDIAGLGNEAFQAFVNTERKAIPVGTDWKRVTIPLPTPAAYAQSPGLFHFAEGSEEGSYTLWFDDIRYVHLPLGLVRNARPAIDDQTKNAAVGEEFSVPGTRVTYTIDGEDVTLDPVPPACFDFDSSNVAVADVLDDGTVRVRARGTSDITGSLAGVPADGTLTVKALERIDVGTNTALTTDMRGRLLGMTYGIDRDFLLDRFSARLNVSDSACEIGFFAWTQPGEGGPYTRRHSERRAAGATESDEYVSDTIGIRTQPGERLTLAVGVTCPNGVPDAIIKVDTGAAVRSAAPGGAQFIWVTKTQGTYEPGNPNMLPVESTADVAYRQSLYIGD